MTVSLCAQLDGTAITMVVALPWPQGAASLTATDDGALSGVATGIGVAFLYRAMSRGALSEVVTVSNVGAVAIPVLAGVAVLGERTRLSGTLHIVVVLPAI